VIAMCLLNSTVLAVLKGKKKGHVIFDCEELEKFLRNISFGKLLSHFCIKVYPIT